MDIFLKITGTLRDRCLAASLIIAVLWLLWLRPLKFHASISDWAKRILFGVTLLAFLFRPETGVWMDILAALALLLSAVPLVSAVREKRFDAIRDAFGSITVVFETPLHRSAIKFVGGWYEFTIHKLPLSNNVTSGKFTVEASELRDIATNLPGKDSEYVFAIEFRVSSKPRGASSMPNRLETMSARTFTDDFDYLFYFIPLPESTRYRSHVNLTLNNGTPIEIDNPEFIPLVYHSLFIPLNEKARSQFGRVQSA